MECLFITLLKIEVYELVYQCQQIGGLAEENLFGVLALRGNERQEGVK